MIRDMINRNLVSVNPDTPVREVASHMDSKNVGSILVLENGRPRGIITDRDIVVRCLSNSKKSIDDFKASDCMTDSVETVRENQGFYECIQKMRNSHIRRIPVVNDQGQAVGILSFDDILSVLSKELQELTEAATGALGSRKKAAA